MFGNLTGVAAENIQYLILVKTATLKELHLVQYYLSYILMIERRDCVVCR